MLNKSLGATEGQIIVCIKACSLSPLANSRQASGFGKTVRSRANPSHWPVTKHSSSGTVVEQRPIEMVLANANKEIKQ